MSEVFRATLSKDDALRLLKETAPHQTHPLTIPGELLAEACEFGHPVLWLGDGGVWIADIIPNIRPLPRDLNARGKTPAEALQAAIVKAREFVK